ncbi:MAG: 4Fe-4S binding protein [Candidatus Hadarchaeum sp.]|uniref:4Fe-4S binding protein n=1 Tax=Candidatus Hadarchaeum sp. TaxID=2883567 RepID=UPI003D10DAB0
MEIDLSLKLAGLELKNPIIVASSAFSRNGATIKKLSEYGPAAIVTKTIVAQPVPHARPCYAAIDGGFINCLSGSDLSADQWFKEEIKIAKEGEVKIIASIAGRFPEESIELAKKAEEAGVDMIEYATACPHLAEIYNAMFPGSMGPPEVHNPEPLAKMLAEIKKEVSIPIMPKFSSIFFIDAVNWAKASEKAGADAIAAADALGPVLQIDIETGQPVLGGPKGSGGLTGPAIKPLVLKMVLDMAENVNIPIVGVGGISSWRDAVEYFMVGATCVGLATAVHLRGPKIIPQILYGIKKFMEDKGYSSLSEIRGLTHRRIKEREIRGKQLITTPKVPEIDINRCNACGICQRACIYEAITVDEFAKIEPAKCFGCGLCVTVCPTKALSLDYYQV